MQESYQEALSEPSQAPEPENQDRVYRRRWSEQVGDLALTYRRWLLGGVLLLAAVLRLGRLGERSLWYDESFSLTLAGRDWATILNGTANDYHPPLPYLALSGWTQLLGSSPYSGRLFSALAGIAFVAAVYGLARQMFGSRTALLAALFAAISPFQILYSQEVRHYSLQALLGTWLLWSFYRAWQRESWRHWASFALAALLSLYNLYFSIFEIIVLDATFVAAVVFYRQTGRGWRRRQITRWVATNLAIGLLYLPWVFIFWQQAGKIQKSYWIQTPNPLEVFRFTNVLLLNATNLTTEPLFALAGLLLGSLVTLFVLNALRSRLRSGDRGAYHRSFEIALLLGYWWGVLGLVLLISYLYAPLYLERSLIGISAPVYILLGRVIQTARRPGWWLLLLLPGVVVLLGALNSYYFSREYTTHYENEPALARLRSLYQPGDVVLHSSKLSYLPLAYLQAPGQAYLVPEEPGNIHDDLSGPTLRAIGMSYTPVGPLLAQTPPAARMWWVRSYPQPGQTEAYLDGIQHQLEARYSPGGSWAYHGLTLYLFTPR